jgi:dTDP-4-dehydrorhamnose 3,5-epimerase
MDVREFAINGLKLIIPKRFSDARGYFQETWSDRVYRNALGPLNFVQDNLSLSLKRGTLRGLHFQKPPYAQGKLVRIGRGSIFDVAVDIRKGSPTFGQHVALTLDATDGAQFWVPPGFLHGFCTLEDNTEVCYKATSYYSPAHDAGVAWDDPELGIEWPVDTASVVLSEKDQQLQRFSELADFFEY